MQKTVFALWICFCYVGLNLTVMATSVTGYSGGSGTPDDPYQIATAQDLVRLGNNPSDYNKHFVLTANIDLDPNLPGNQVFDRSVIAPVTISYSNQMYSYNGKPFTGSFNGQGYVIRNLNIIGQEVLGLFGGLAAGAIITNLGLEAVDINGAGGYIGALVGWNNDSYITLSYSSGSVRGDDKVGGLVGDNNYHGVITSSYSSGSINEHDEVDSLVRYIDNSSIITSSHRGSMPGSGYVGGFVGMNNGTITSSFWDTESSGLMTSSGGIGLSTVDMQNITSYLEQGWDFVNETINGTEDLWWINEGQDYPRLWWELD